MTHLQQFGEIFDWRAIALCDHRVQQGVCLGNCQHPNLDQSVENSERAADGNLELCSQFACVPIICKQASVAVRCGSQTRSLSCIDPDKEFPVSGLLGGGQLDYREPGEVCLRQNTTHNACRDLVQHRRGRGNLFAQCNADQIESSNQYEIGENCVVKQQRYWELFASP